MNGIIPGTKTPPSSDEIVVYPMVLDIPMLKMMIQRIEEARRDATDSWSKFYCDKPIIKDGKEYWVHVKKGVEEKIQYGKHGRSHLAIDLISGKIVCKACLEGK